MYEEGLDIKDIITIAIGVVSIVVPTYLFLISSPEEIRNQAIIVFTGIMIVLLLGVPIFYFYNLISTHQSRLRVRSK
ncbi:hypothetical protein J4221_03660 [Candidatus Pacearchaeota archaeon]|nr:hypothetical protein [Candidatus Pacearchaeota archaeon]